MALFDLPAEELRTYLPDRHEPSDFDDFWAETLAESRQHPLNPTLSPVDLGLVTLDVHDLTFAGYDGHPVKGWLVTPAGATGPLPALVEYIGYGGGRGFPHQHTLWASAGYAHLIMDTRGQGATMVGDTPDPGVDGTSQNPGFMTRGIRSPYTYYYRRVYTDAVRAVEAARSLPQIDPTRVGVRGGSQGGGIALAAAGLVPDVSVAIPDVPFLCHFRRAVRITDKQPYVEVASYCRYHRDQIDEVFRTLSYMDGMNFAARAKAPTLFSVAFMDATCPPSTVYAAYNHYAGPKEIREWEFNDHEGGNEHQQVEQLAFLRKHLPL